jgi:hypothetical protein
MIGRRASSSPLLIACALFVVLSLAACTEVPDDPGECPAQRTIDINQLPPYSASQQLPFRFPLADLSASQKRPSAPFQISGLETPTRREYHAAEDYASPPGTPVYAIAGGRVSFSGPMGGYGWLVIVDHPQANLYSLYGHLSPSRWQIETGPVEQGDLLGYLGDDDENGGSVEQPLEPHLHLGLRAGQRSDYSGTGEWRWQAGWITPCPTNLGWLQPTKIMTGQQIPPGGFTSPTGGFIEMWGVELLLAGVYLTGAIFVVIYGLRRDKPFSILGYGAMMLVAGIFLSGKSFRMAPVSFIVAAVLLVTGIYLLIARSRRKAEPTHNSLR